MLESFGNLTGLTGLDLSRNNPDRLPESISNLTALWKLYLNNNQSNSIPDFILILQSQGVEVRYSGNPLSDSPSVPVYKTAKISP